MMQKHSPSNQIRRDARRMAFTLVEMLVAVALVLLMMSLFTEIFSLATSTMSRQKGISENDQRARMVATLLGSDFRKRTFRDVVPFVPGMTIDAQPLKRGYFAFSENTPSDDTDDVLRLTIDTTQTQQDIGRDLNYSEQPELDVARDNFLLFGRATEIGGGVAADPNQPEGDDGIATANGAGQSTIAEVVWFLRGGNLYRRMMLIRKPYRSDTPNTPVLSKYDATTENDPPSNNPIITSGYASFWKNFDYSSFYGPNGHVQFHIASSLDNLSTGDLINVGTLGNVPISLGIPPFRFGYSPNSSSLSPREYDSSTPPKFFGSFTHEETSHLNFKYPGQAVTSGSDDPYTMPITLDTATNSITQFTGGTRVGEDLLLSNVVSFDIKIWDQGADKGPDGQYGFAGVDDDGDGGTDNSAREAGGLYPWINPATGVENANKGALSDDGRWVDLGHNDSNGFYSRASGTSNGTNTSYGNRFDTWHPFSAMPSLPPYLPARYVPTATPMATAYPNRATPVWQIGGGPHNVGKVILPTATYQTTQGLRFAYVCVQAGFSGLTEPNWPTILSETVTETTDPMVSPAMWMAIPNLIPVRAIQVRVRYLDISSGLIKDLTLVESLRDDL